MHKYAHPHMLGCIGKCTTGLSKDELDQITDTIHNTLAHPKGRLIFRNFLQKCNYIDRLDCLKLYEKCCDVVTKNHCDCAAVSEPTLDNLKQNFLIIKEMAEEFDGIPEIDLDLLRRFNNVMKSNSKDDIIMLLEHTKELLCDNLKQVHPNFKRFVLEPCPNT